MPDSWDPEIYRQRAHAWRNRANILPSEDPAREACVNLARAYERLVRLIIEGQRKPEEGSQ